MDVLDHAARYCAARPFHALQVGVATLVLPARGGGAVETCLEPPRLRKLTLVDLVDRLLDHVVVEQGRSRLVELVLLRARSLALSPSSPVLLVLLL